MPCTGGSHRDQLENHVFTSFGDHTGLRYAFPDILSYMFTSKTLYENIRLPLWFNEKLTEATRLTREILLKEAAHMLLKINAHGPILEEKFIQISKGAATTSILALLKDMNYLTCERGVLKLDYPVFTVEEKRVIQQIADIAVPLTVQVIRKNHSKIKRALCGLTPLKNNVSFEEIFNEVWHWIFAKTNKNLAEKGFFYNPPRKRKTEARYMAWVSEFNYP